MHQLAFIFGTTLAIAGVLLLFAGWHARRAGRHAQRAFCTSAGWLLLASSLLPWIVFGGNDRGVALAVIAFMLAGAGIVLVRGTQHRARARRANGERDTVESYGRPNGDIRLLMRRIWVFLLAGPLSFAVAMLATALIYAAWSGLASNRLAITMLIVPVIWTALAIYATYDVPLKQRSIGVLGVLVASGLTLFMLLPETI